MYTCNWYICNIVTGKDLCNYQWYNCLLKLQGKKIYFFFYIKHKSFSVLHTTGMLANLTLSCILSLFKEFSLCHFWCVTVSRLHSNTICTFKSTACRQTEREYNGKNNPFCHQQTFPKLWGTAEILLEMKVLCLKCNHNFPLGLQFLLLFFSVWADNSTAPSVIT